MAKKEGETKVMIPISDELHRELKMLAASMSTTLKDLITTFIQEGVRTCKTQVQ